MEIEIEIGRLKPLTKVVVIISGEKYAGKDTLGLIIKNILSSECAKPLNPNSKLCAFAAKVKTEYSQMHNVPLEDLTNRQTKELHREGLIAHGMFRRSEHPEYWYECVEREIEDFFFKEEQDKTIELAVGIITDCRFPNELKNCRKFCRYQNAICVAMRVNASLETRKMRGCPMDEELLNSPSETALNHLVLRDSRTPLRIDEILLKTHPELRTEFTDVSKLTKLYYEPIRDYVPCPVGADDDDDDMGWDHVFKNDFATIEEFEHLVKQEILGDQL